MLATSLQALLLNLCPRILEGDRSVEDRMAGNRVTIDTEIAHPLKLVTHPRNRIAQPRLDLASRQNLERLGIEVGREVLPFLNLVWILFGEERLIKPDFRVDGMGGRDPVDGRLDLPPIRGIPSTRLRIIGAAQLDDPALGILDRFTTGDQIAITQPDLAPRGQPIELLRRSSRKSSCSM